MSWQPIVRHVPLKTDMNPYVDHDYFAARRKALKQRYARSFRLPTARS